MNISTKKIFSTTIAAIIFSTAALATAPSASAGQWRHGGGHGGGFNAGNAALGLGLGVLMTMAITSAVRNNGHVRHVNPAKKRCKQAKQWIRLALASERQADRDAKRGDMRSAAFERREAKRRWARSRQARKDCNRWARR